MSIELNTVPDAVEAIRRGEVVIVVDAEDRENELSVLRSEPGIVASCSADRANYTFPSSGGIETTRSEPR